MDVTFNRSPWHRKTSNVPGLRKFYLYVRRDNGQLVIILFVYCYSYVKSLNRPKNKLQRAELILPPTGTHLRKIPHQ